MKNINSIIIIILLISISSLGQTKPIFFYNENGEKITEKSFFDSRNDRKNLDLYFENDSLKFGLLVRRHNFGQLDSKTFKELKSYLTEISREQIDTTHNIVINYLTAIPKIEEDSRSRSTWNIFHKNYLKKLHKTAGIIQFWINSPEADNLEYYHQDKINWIPDRENFLKKLFFPYDVNYGNYILIRPDGRFYYYLGEHGKKEIWENAKKYFK